MPYRHAHWWIVALFPLIAIAFWPNYLGRFGASSFALHAHGMTASAWLLLLAAQSWSIHARRVDWHRAAGLATFVVLPLFAAAGPLALWSMIELYVAKSDPFHTAYGSKLAWADLVSGPTVIGLTVYAFVQRRRVRAHSAAMLATALTVLPPVLGRLTGYVPGFPQNGTLGMTNFELSFQLAQLVSLVAAMWLAREPAARPAFLAVAASMVIQMIGFGSFAGTPAWAGLARQLVLVPVVPVSIAAGLATFALLWWAWRQVPPRAAATTGRGAAVAA